MKSAEFRRAHPWSAALTPALVLLALVSATVGPGFAGGANHVAGAIQARLADACPLPSNASIARVGACGPVAGTGAPTVSMSFAVTFSESGLSSGTRWSATLAGTTSFSTNSTVTFYEPNGTFEFSVGAVDGKSASPSSGSVTVKGFAQKVDLSFSSPTGFLGLSGANGYYFILIVTSVLIVGGIAAVVLHRRRSRDLDFPTEDERPGR